MLKIRNILILLGMLLSPVASADVQVGIGIGLPHVNIGIHVPAYPRLVPVPGYPVYYAPYVQANLFFYDGLYWVYQDDYWYASEWYDGPWWLVDPMVVPVFILRIPVRYYRHPPTYFYGWLHDAPPRWGHHWGRDWERHRRGWDRWDRRSVPPYAPPPIYQRQYSGDRYPRHLEHQQELHQQNYRYQPRDPVVRKRYQERAVQGVPQRERRGDPEVRDYRQQDMPRSMPRQQNGSPPMRSQPPQRGEFDIQRSTPASPQDRDMEASPRQQQGFERREQQIQRPPGREERQRGSEAREFRQQEGSSSTRAQPPQRGGLDIQRSPPASPQERRMEASPRQQQQQRFEQREPQMQRSPEQGGRRQGHESNRGQMQGQERSRDRGQ